jgi:hypothetical protein
MTHRFLRLVGRPFRIVVLSLLFLALAYGWIQAQVTPTNEWVDFFSASSTFLGTPVPVGAVIRAFDPDGVQCGEFTVVVEGAYGVMPCYRDDDTTTEDEGAEPGDVISFTINGFPATPIPRTLNGTPVPAGTSVTWTAHGDRWEVDLQVVASPTPSPSPTQMPGVRPVGGYGESSSVLALLAPWLGLMTLIIVGALGTLWRRRVS